MGLCLCIDRGVSSKPSQVLVPCKLAFRQPVEPLGVSAGSSTRLFRLVPTSVSRPAAACEGAAEEEGLQGGRAGSEACGSRRWEPGAAHPGEEWLGKDVVGTLDEAEFYDAAWRLRQGLGACGCGGASVQAAIPEPVPTDLAAAEDGCSERWRVLDYLVAYHGIVRAQVCYVPGGAGQPRERQADLMVFRSPLQGVARPRLLHLEVGPRTTALQCRRGPEEVDTTIFARQEGVRVEGFLAPPRSVAWEEPTHEVRGWTWGDDSQRRAKRLPLQRLRPGDALAALVDLRDAIAEERLWPSESSCRFTSCAGQAAAFSEEFLGSAEYAELALLAIVRELAALLRACADVPMPQRWVGSSLSLLVEAGAAPPRSGPVEPQAWVAARVKLKIFGWNRSRVMSPLAGRFPSLLEQEDNENLWHIYQDSVACVLWEAARLYHHAFCTQEWGSLRVEVFEAATSEDRLLGAVEVNLDGAAAAGRSDAFVLSEGMVPTSAAYSPEWKPAAVSVGTSFALCRQVSRFHGLWRVRLDSAVRLPAAAAAAPASAAGEARSIFAVVCARGSPAGRPWTPVACHRTKAVSYHGKEGAVWEEEFEFPVVSADDAATGAAEARLSEALGLASGAEVGAWEGGTGGTAAGCSGNSVQAAATGGGELCPEGLAAHLPPPEVLGARAAATSSTPTGAPACAAGKGAATPEAREAAARQLAFVALLRSSAAAARA